MINFGTYTNEEEMNYIIGLFPTGFFFECDAESYNIIVSDNNCDEIGFIEKSDNDHTIDKEAIISIGFGMKDKSGKPQYNLIPSIPIDYIAQVLTFGAKKYSENSWQNVSNGIEEYRAAAMRHIFKMQAGEVLDKETGLPHSAHALTNLAFISYLEVQQGKTKDPFG